MRYSYEGSRRRVGNSRTLAAGSASRLARQRSGRYGNSFIAPSTSWRRFAGYIFLSQQWVNWPRNDHLAVAGH